MLTTEQKKQILDGLQRGVTDTQIAQTIGVKHMAVFQFRKSLGMTSKQVVDLRYDTWIRLIESGTTVERVAELYKVRASTVLTTLYRKRNFSYTEAKVRARLSLEEAFRAALGLTEKEMKRQQRALWRKLARGGMAVKSIAMLYNVSVATVRRSLRSKDM
ncbi:hypothetical protein DBB29_24780 [Pandoraea cepalis]|uniref:Uncharacterized protein n=1 Tax=Pandoraea cepalis TaxID=2508294 RepID=A0AAW7MGL8_9BURK|nr:hypothetical protein [Pandoraea cepalis]MDN4571877.1 hypothetical protein [Pandoraea cepalis]MDN4581331.1 hypothetical protein [Pandoraea cepalis]